MRQVHRHSWVLGQSEGVKALLSASSWAPVQFLVTLPLRSGSFYGAVTQRPGVNTPCSFCSMLALFVQCLLMRSAVSKAIDRSILRQNTPCDDHDTHNLDYSMVVSTARSFSRGNDVEGEEQERGIIVVSKDIISTKGLHPSSDFREVSGHVFGARKMVLHGQKTADWVLPVRRNDA
jgi:hypothetical protein